MPSKEVAAIADRMGILKRNMERLVEIQENMATRLDGLEEDVRVTMSSFRAQLGEFQEAGLFEFMEEMRVKFSTIKRAMTNNNPSL